MAAPSTTRDLLATAWLAPPQGFLPSSHKSTIEPAFIATSAILAFLILVVVTLIFNMKKKSNFFDDVTKDNTNHDHISAILPAFQERTSVEAVGRNHRSGQSSVLQDPERDAPIREPVTIPVIREPPRVHQHHDSAEDSTDDSLSDFGDESTLVGNSPYVRNDHPAHLSSIDLRRYPTSFIPSKFKPLLPEDVGMEGKVWK